MASRSLYIRDLLKEHWVPIMGYAAPLPIRLSEQLIPLQDFRNRGEIPYCTFEARWNWTDRQRQYRYSKFLAYFEDLNETVVLGYVGYGWSASSIDLKGLQHKPEVNRVTGYVR